jgi:hypothetical protein
MNCSNEKIFLELPGTEVKVKPGFIRPAQEGKESAAVELHQNIGMEIPVF